ncbi:hypothetical protein JMM81_20645 [Bacillus sp. V3B]|nr:hypothetical protein [Bacillus sp. V3B]MCQ6277286.1 hypothetical protein [Bacillus sp. V3B]
MIREKTIYILLTDTGTILTRKERRLSETGVFHAFAAMDRTTTFVRLA